MFIDNIFIAIIALGALRGWWKGFVRTIANVCGLVSGYILLWLFSAEAGEIISSRYGIPTQAATILAGSGMILGTSVIGAIAGYLIKRRKVASLSEEEKEEFLLDDSYSGSWVGLVQGLLLSCFIALMLSILPATNKFAVHLEVADSAFVDLMAPLAPVIVDSVTTEMFGDTTNAKIAAAVLSNPEEAQKAAKQIIKSEAVMDLVESEDFIKMLESGTAEEVATNQQMINVFKDPEVIAAFAKLGISEEDLQLTPEDMTKIVEGYRDAMAQIAEIKGGNIPENIQGSIPKELLSDPDMLPKLMNMFTQLSSGTSQQSGEKK